MAADKVVDFRDYNVNVKDISKVNPDIIKDIGKQIIHKFKTYGCWLCIGHDGHFVILLINKFNV